MRNAITPEKANFHSQNTFYHIVTLIGYAFLWRMNENLCVNLIKTCTTGGWLLFPSSDVIVKEIFCSPFFIAPISVDELIEVVFILWFGNCVEHSLSLTSLSSLLKHIMLCLIGFTSTIWSPLMFSKCRWMLKCNVARLLLSCYL